MTDVTIATLDGQQMPAYRADPAGAPRGAIVVIQEIFGVNAGIRRKCDTLAAAGYLAIAPDLFWRMEPGIELDPEVYIANRLTPEERQHFETQGYVSQPSQTHQFSSLISALACRWC